jgi:anaerobic selenocysteine-containing dehydrogenase
VLGEIAAGVKPDLADKVRFTDTQAIRDEIADIVPFYQGIEKLREEGDNFQYNGRMLCEDWNFPTPSGKANFKAVALPQSALRDGEFIISTRRGKQFNSIVHENVETGNHLRRDAILINATDAHRLGFEQGDSVKLSNQYGIYSGKLAFEDIALGTVAIYWPEGNVLVDPDKRSPLAQIPVYKGTKAMLSRQTEPLNIS